MAEKCEVLRDAGASDEQIEQILKCAEGANAFQVRANIQQQLADRASDRAEELAAQFGLEIEWFGALDFEFVSTRVGA